MKSEVAGGHEEVIVMSGETRSAAPGALSVNGGGGTGGVAGPRTRRLSWPPTRVAPEAVSGIFVAEERDSGFADVGDCAAHWRRAMEVAMAVATATAASPPPRRGATAIGPGRVEDEASSTYPVGADEGGGQPERRHDAGQASEGSLYPLRARG